MKRFCVMIASVFFLGCGGSEIPKPVAVQPAASPTLKQCLQGIADTGEVGSAGMTLNEEFTKLKTSDAGKSSAIETDLKALQQANDPEQVKDLAKRVAEKL